MHLAVLTVNSTSPSPSSNRFRRLSDGAGTLYPPTRLPSPNPLLLYSAVRGCGSAGVGA